MLTAVWVLCRFGHLLHRGSTAGCKDFAAAELSSGLEPSHGRLRVDALQSRPSFHMVRSGCASRSACMSRYIAAKLIKGRATHFDATSAYVIKAPLGHILQP